MTWRNPHCIRDAEKALDEGKLYTAMSGGKFWLARRNGKTQTWKRDQERIRIPVKCGFRLCGELSHITFSPRDLWRIADSREEAEGPQNSAYDDGCELRHTASHLV